MVYTQLPSRFLTGTIAYRAADSFRKMEKMAISQTVRNASPFLKWAGEKTQLLPMLLNYIPAHFDTCIEPFAGGGALFFELQPAKAVLADSNPELINCYMMVRDRAEALIAVLTAYPYSEEFYYALRAEMPQDPVLRAARMIYLNRTKKTSGPP